ncbi:D-inositol-3-phosphate glycosyltransferase (EC [Olavius sp. associated proteobacterium Delta 1]|nr:D-inositol-3-phosphate glycosyltransferase (EC [Olavius sp. associated proteobacterium Delta 1]
MKDAALKIAMFSIHSCPIGELGTKDTGGMNVYIRELSRELGNRGHRIDIYTRRHDPQDPQVIEINENVRVIHLKAGKNGYMHKLDIYPYLSEITSALEDFRTREGIHYDLIHSHYWLSGRVGNWAQNYWEIPHLIMFHTLGAVKNTTGIGEQEPRLRIATEGQLVKNCDRIITATEKEITELERFYGAPADRMRIIPCGVDLNLFRPVDQTTARRQLGFDPAQKLLLYVGRLEPQKGIERLLGAISHLKHFRKIKLAVIGGDGHHEPEFQRLLQVSRELDIRDKVFFAGRVDQQDLPTYYSAANLLVVPSHHESFGLVALEALACGTPVVASDVGAMGRIIIENETGCVVSRADSRRLADKIEAYFNELRFRFGSPETIRNSVAKFAWPNIADALIEEYVSVLNQSNSRNLIESISKLEPLMSGNLAKGGLEAYGD